HCGHAGNRVALKDERHAVLPCTADQRHGALFVDRGDDQDVDAFGDEVFGGRDHACNVEIRIANLEFDAELLGTVFHALDDILVPLVGGIVRHVADLGGQVLRDRRTGHDSTSCGGGEQRNEGFLHV